MPLLIRVSDTSQVRKKPLQLPVLSIRDRLRRSFRLRLLAEQIREERETLSTLSESELRDIGITQADVAEETRRGFWDLPEDRVGKLEK